MLRFGRKGVHMSKSSVLALSHMGLRGIVRSWGVVNPDGSVAQKGDEAQNLILDQGMDEVASRQLTALSAYCAVGTGQTAPAVTDTGLESEVARTGNTTDATSYKDDGTSTFSGTGYTPDFLEHRRVFEFAQGVLDGTYYELGFSWANSAGENLFSRLLFEDEQGNPIGVVVDSSQQLRVTYSLFVYPKPTTVETGTFDITGVGTVGYSCAMQKWAENGNQANEMGLDRLGGSVTGAMLEPSYNGTGFNGTAGLFVSPNAYSFATFPGQNGNPGGSVPVDSHTKQVYTQGNFYVDHDYVWDPATYNDTVASIVMTFDDYFFRIAYAIVIDSADRFTKADTHRLTLTLRHSWARA